MKKVVKEFSGLSSNLCISLLSLSVIILEAWGPGCSLLFYEPKEPKDLQKVNLKDLRKKL